MEMGFSWNRKYPWKEQRACIMHIQKQHEKTGTSRMNIGQWRQCAWLSAYSKKGSKKRLRTGFVRNLYGLCTDRCWFGISHKLQWIQIVFEVWGTSSDDNLDHRNTEIVYQVQNQNLNIFSQYIKYWENKQSFQQMESNGLCRIL